MEVTALKKPNLRLVVNNQPQEVVYEITKDPALLNQYYKLREECYRQDLGLKSFSGAEDEYDRMGIIVVARVGKRVVGGSRIIISSPDRRVRLPLETDNFCLMDRVSELSLKRKTYCEFSRLAVVSGYRNQEIAIQISKMLVEIAKANGCEYEFIISSMISYRVHRAIAKKLGIDQILLAGIDVPRREIYGKLNKEGIYLSIASFGLSRPSIPENLLFNSSQNSKNMVA